MSPGNEFIDPCPVLCPQCERQMTQSLLDTKANTFVTLPPGEIRPPSKLIDRTHHVTEKVTQVSGSRFIFQDSRNKNKSCSSNSHLGPDKAEVPFSVEMLPWMDIGHPGA